MKYDIEVGISSNNQRFMTSIVSNVTGRDGSVGTATRYGLDGPGIEFQ
jgi:hypothetical protein